MADKPSIEIHGVLQKTFEGRRIGCDEALTLLLDAPLLDLGRAAFAMRDRLHPGGEVTYIVDRNINYTNACISGCPFCAFSRKPGSGDSFVLSRDGLHRKIEETREMGGTGILLQGGHNPDLPLSYYEEMLTGIREVFPEIHIHAFSPTEITFFSKNFEIPVDRMVSMLREWGLMSIPGGGAEVLSERIRGRMAGGKASVAEWLGVMREAHGQGLKTTATMMFGSVEEPEDLLVHLGHLRTLQDETMGFTAFIPWTFQPGGGTVYQKSEATGVDYLRLLAVSRLFLDNFPHVQASWVTQGLQMGQVALHFGADDLGSVMIEENVVAAAGCRNRTNEEELRRVIEDAGFIPKKRRTLYEPA
jgi:cyclic dehypoxanthinyl futalosine synthase